MPAPYVESIDEDRVNALENLLPNWKGVVSWTHVIGDLRTLLRANYYGEWDDTGNDVPGMGAEVLVDAEVAYMFRENIEFIAGVDNLFDKEYAQHLNRASAFDPVQVQVNEPGLSAWIRLIGGVAGVCPRW